MLDMMMDPSAVYRSREQQRDRERAVRQRDDVKAHLTHIYRKLGVSDRTAAVATALERQIIAWTTPRCPAQVAAKPVDEGGVHLRGLGALGCWLESRFLGERVTHPRDLHY